MRIDEHVERVYELERKLNVAISCGAVTPPTDSSRQLENRTDDFRHHPAAHVQYRQLFNDVIVTAMLCDTSPIATMHFRQIFSTSTQNWHQDIAHQADESQSAQDTLLAAHQTVFAGVFCDLIDKLDVDLGDGTTVLDSSFVTWTHESGNVTHNNSSMPVISAGGAGGFSRTGNDCDYSDRSRTEIRGLQGRTPGINWNQYLATCLQAMGVPPSEWATESEGGYGRIFVSNTDRYPDVVSRTLNDILPFLAAS